MESGLQTSSHVLLEALEMSVGLVLTLSGRPWFYIPLNRIEPWCVILWFTDKSSDCCFDIKIMYIVAFHHWSTGLFMLLFSWIFGLGQISFLFCVQNGPTSRVPVLLWNSNQQRELTHYQYLQNHWHLSMGEFIFFFVDHFSQSHHFYPALFLWAITGSNTRLGLVS